MLLLGWGECRAAHLPAWLSRGQWGLCCYLSTCLQSGAPQLYLCGPEFLSAPPSASCRGPLDINKSTRTHTNGALAPPRKTDLQTATSTCTLDRHLHTAHINFAVQFWKKKNNQTHKVPGRFSRQHLFKILRRCKTFTADLDISHVNVSIKFLLMWISIKDQLFNGSSPPHSSPPHRRKKLFDICDFQAAEQKRALPLCPDPFFMYETSAWLQVSSSSLCAYGKLKRGELICVFLCENRDGGC